MSRVGAKTRTDEIQIPVNCMHGNNKASFKRYSLRSVIGERYGWKGAQCAYRPRYDRMHVNEERQHHVVLAFRTDKTK